MLPHLGFEDAMGGRRHTIRLNRPNKRAPRGLPAQGPCSGKRRLTRSCWRTSAGAACVRDGIRIRQVGQQRRLRSEHGRERIVAADFIAPGGWRSGHPTHADCAEELTVDHDGKRAGIGEIALPRDAGFGHRTAADGVHLRLAGRAGVQRGAGLPQSGFRVDFALAVAAHIISDGAELIENNDADAQTLAGGFVEAMVAERLGGGKIDLILFHDFLGRVALLDDVVNRGGAERGSGQSRGGNASQQREMKLHLDSLRLRCCFSIWRTFCHGDSRMASSECRMGHHKNRARPGPLLATPYSLFAFFYWFGAPLPRGPAPPPESAWRLTSGSSGGCGPRTLVRARQAQISSLQTDRKSTR